MKNNTIDLALQKAMEAGDPVHIVQYEKSKKVLKFYDALGKFVAGMFVLFLVLFMGTIIWWVFAENMWQLLVLFGIGSVIVGFSKACAHYEKHRKTVERAERDGTIDD